MVPALEEVNPLSPDELHDAVLLSQTPRPKVRAKMLERLGLSNSDERIAHDRLNQFKNAQSDPPIRLNPVA